MLLLEVFLMRNRAAADPVICHRADASETWMSSKSRPSLADQACPCLLPSRPDDSCNLCRL